MTESSAAQKLLFIVQHPRRELFFGLYFSE